MLDCGGRRNDVSSRKATRCESANIAMRLSGEQCSWHAMQVETEQCGHGGGIEGDALPVGGGFGFK